MAHDPGFANAPSPPYFVVIFTSRRTDLEAGYEQTAARMVELASVQPGFLGVESARDTDGFGITVSYWRTLDDIARWRDHLEHTAAREQGRASWYSRYALRIAKVERAYDWEAPSPRSERS